MNELFQNVYRLKEVSEERLPEYLKQNEEILDIQFPQEYLQRSTSYALLDQDDKICGGLIIAHRPPFRSLQSIPAEFIETTMETLGPVEEVAEINGVWVAPDFRSPFVSFSFWQQMIGVLLETGKRRFLFTINDYNLHMRGHVNVLEPQVLFSGKTIQLDGMKESTCETILSIPQESLPAVAEMLQRRGIGSAKPTETDLIRRIRSRKGNAPVYGNDSQGHVQP